MGDSRRIGRKSDVIEESCRETASLRWARFSRITNSPDGPRTAGSDDRIRTPARMDDQREAGTGRSHSIASPRRAMWTERALIALIMGSLAATFNLLVIVHRHASPGPPEPTVTRNSQYDLAPPAPAADRLAAPGGSESREVPAFQSLPSRSLLCRLRKIPRRSSSAGWRRRRLRKSRPASRPIGAPWHWRPLETRRPPSRCDGRGGSCWSVSRLPAWPSRRRSGECGERARRRTRCAGARARRTQGRHLEGEPAVGILPCCPTRALTGPGGDRSCWSARPAASISNRKGRHSHRSSSHRSSVRDRVRSCGRSPGRCLHVQASDTPDGAAAVPYLVFLVRPNGIRPYYEARTCLEPLGIAFGYELIDQDLVVDIPDFDNLATWDGSVPLDMPVEPAPAPKMNIAMNSVSGRGAGVPNGWPQSSEAEPDNQPATSRQWRRVGA